MSTSFSYRTPQASLSSSDMSINLNSENDNRSSSYHSAAIIFSKRNRANSGIHLQTLTSSPDTTTTTDQYESAQSSTDLRVDDDEQTLSSYYEHNRLKQEKLVIISNLFRLLVIIILAPIIYFTV